MKIVLVNAASSSKTEVDILQKWIFASFPELSRLARVDLGTKNILPCSACMACQIKNPGICVRKDDMQDLLPIYIQSDIAVLVTPLFCGGYSSELKKFIDRLCPVLAACFEKRYGETWHVPRYPKRPVMIGIGLSDSPRTSETLYHQLFSRNMRQFNISEYCSQVIVKGMNQGELQKIFNHCFNMAGIAI